MILFLDSKHVSLSKLASKELEERLFDIWSAERRHMAMAIKYCKVC